MQPRGGSYGVLEAEPSVQSQPAAARRSLSKCRPTWKRCAFGGFLVVQCLGLVAVATYLGLSPRQPAASDNIVRTFPTSGMEGCPISVGQAVSFTDEGTVAKGGGVSMYKTTGQVFFSSPVVAHTVTSLDDRTIVGAFITADGTSYLVAGTTVDPGANAIAWAWQDMLTLSVTRAESIARLSNSTFIVAGGGYATLGWLVPQEGGIVVDLYISEPVMYGDDEPWNGGATTFRSSLAVLSPKTVAISFYTSTAVNASLATRVGTVVLPPINAGQDGASATPKPADSSLGLQFGWPTLVWGAVTSYAGAHLSHTIAAVDEHTYILAFPLDDGVSATSGFPLSVIVASVDSPPPPPTDSTLGTRSNADATTRCTDASDVRVTLGQSAVLPDVRAHYLFEAVALSPSQLVCVFVDASLNDGIRAVTITVGPNLQVTFGTTLVVNSGSAGGVSSTGSWLHLSVKSMVPGYISNPGPSPIDTWLHGDDPIEVAVTTGKVEASESATSRRRGVGVKGLPKPRLLQSGTSITDDDTYFDDDDGNFDDDSAHTVPGLERDGKPFVVSFSDLANVGRVTALVGTLTPSADLLVTSPAFLVSAPAPAGSSSTTPGAPSPYWVSATTLTPTRLVLVDTVEVQVGALAHYQSAPLEDASEQEEDGDALQPRAGQRSDLRTGGRSMFCVHPLAARGGKGGGGGGGMIACAREHTRHARSHKAATATGHPMRALQAPPLAPLVAQSVANVSLLEILHDPIGIALTDAACGSTVQVLLEGVFTFSNGMPQPVTPDYHHRRRNQTAATLRRVGTAGNTAASATGAATPVGGDGPFEAGRAYYASTTGALVEGSYAGVGGMSAYGGTNQGGYISSLSTKSHLSGQTNVAFNGYMGLAISSNQLSIRPLQ